MTTQPGAEPSDSASASQTSASQTTKPLRDLGALVLVGANAVFLVVALLNLLFTDNDFLASSFPTRAARSFDGFVNLATIALPFVAVLLATHVQPAIARARLITLVALVEYGVSIFFGAFFGLLVGLVGLVENSAWTAFLALLTRLAWLALLVTAAHTVLRIWNTHFTAPKPKPQPQPGFYGPGYGQPGYPQHGGYPYPPYQSAGYGQPYGQPSSQPGPSQPGPSQPGPTYVSAQQAASPVSAPPTSPPVSPSPAFPSSAPPAPPTEVSGTEATQAIRMPEPPAGSGEGDAARTQMLRPLDPSTGGPGETGDGPDSQRTQVINPTDPK